MTSKITRTFAVLGLLGFALAAFVQAEETPSVETIVENANRVSYYQGEDGRAQVTMTITDSQGRERKRQFTILRKDDQPESGGGDEHTGEQFFYVYFHRPADVNKMVFMVHKHIGKSDDRWLYLPALDLVKRIAAGDERTSFVGSDFFYEDVSGRGPEEDHHELIETTENYYVLKNTPKDSASVEFAYFKAWIHRATFLPVKIEYYKEGDVKYREYNAVKVETIDGFPTVVQSKMTDLRSNSETVLSYAGLKYNIGLPQDIFTEQYLRNAPKKFMK
jgi:hypothetical protein